MLLKRINILDIGYQRTCLMILIYIYIYSNIKHLYKQSYMISNNVSHCSKATTIILFKSFVSNIYLSSIWLPNRANMRKIKVVYNNAYRIVMKYKCRNSASLMFLYDNVNNLTIKLLKSYNSFINVYEILVIR